jgi:hypothetical protein
MKKLTILPGAAGIIALTATIGFVDGQREGETERYSRERISLVGAPCANAGTQGVATNAAAGLDDKVAWLVEYRRGEKSGRVLIDAATGKVLLS